MKLNEQIVSAIGQKRSKDEINQKYLSHHRLDHIREDRISKLKKERIFGSLHPESYPTCESCLQKKIVKLSFVGYEERATEILVLVYTNMCGPFDV